MMIAAAFVLANDTLCAAIGETPAACLASLERAPDDVIELFEGQSPVLALVDDAKAPRSWRTVETFYRVRDTTVGFEVGEGNLFADLDEAVSAAEALDATGDGWDCEVVAFDSPTDSGRVVWGA